MEAFSRWLSYITIFEMYGIMVSNGFLDVNLVDDTMSGGILMTWDLYGPIIMFIRENLGYPQFQEHQELLTIKIRDIVNQQHPEYKGSTGS